MRFGQAIIKFQCLLRSGPCLLVRLARRNLWIVKTVDGITFRHPRICASKPGIACDGVVEVSNCRANALSCAFVPGVASSQIRFIGLGVNRTSFRLEVLSLL